MVYAHKATPNHTPSKQRCLIKKKKIDETNINSHFLLFVTNLEWSCNLKILEAYESKATCFAFMKIIMHH